MKRLAFLALATALLVAAAPGTPPAAAQEEEPVGEQLFIDSVDVNVVNVDVYVTDKEGEPVTGLTADDFEVLENGRPMKVTNFYAIAGNRVAIGPEGVAAPPPAAVPGVPADPAGPTIPEDQRLSLIVYVDNINIEPHHRRRVLQDVRTFLRENLAPDDQVMLVTYDRSLKVRQPFTRDGIRIVEALFEVDELSGQAVHSASERRDIMRRIEDAGDAPTALMWAEGYAEAAQNDLHGSIDALKDLVGSLAGLPGRKAVLYVSDGIPMIPGEDVFYAVDQLYQQTGALTTMYRFDASRRYEELAAQANANRVSFYTIDAAGLRVYGAASAENAGRGQAGSLRFIDSIHTQNLQSPLQLLAETTGGRAILNQNRVLPALQRMGSDFRTYYSLGYTPGHSGDGRFYGIEVKVKGRRDLTVRHRSGYRDKTQDAQMTDGVLAALNFPYSSNPLDLKLTFDRGARRDDGHYMVPVNVEVPIRSLTLVPRGDEYTARARIYLAAMDEQGWVSPVQETELPISVPKDAIEQALGQHYTYTVSLLMRGGPQKVAVGLRDEIAANNSFVTGLVNPGPR